MTTTTIRRTARLFKGAQPAKLAALLEAPVALAEEPKKSRGYVAVNFSFDARTEKVHCTANKDMTIVGENGASVALKAGEKFYAVRAANIGENKWYIVRNVIGVKKCSCPAIKPCIHEAHIATGKPLAELRAEVEARAKARKASCKPVTPKATEQDVTPVEVTPIVEAAPVVIESVAATPVQEYRMSEGVYEKLAAIAREKQQALEPKPTIQERAKSSEVAQRGTLNNAPQTTQMPAWLAILPSRQRAAIV